MKTRGKTIDRKLAAIDPLAGEDLAGLSSGPGPESLLRAILASDVEERKASRGPSPAQRSRRRRLAIVAPIAVAALLLSILGVPGGGGDNPATLPALAKAAEVAAAQPAADTSMPYRYEKTQSRYLDTAVWSKELAWSFFVSDTIEEWIAEDGSGRRHRVVAPVKFAAPEDREAWEAAGRPSFQPHAWSGRSEDEILRPSSESNRIYEAEIAGMPTDRGEISEWLIAQVTKSHNGFSPAVRSLNLVSEILNDPLVTPDQRAALYEAEGGIPGIEYFGETEDAIGRPGVAIGAESSNSGASTRYSLIFDPRTSRVLATEETWLKPPSAYAYEKAPVLSGAKLFIESGGARSLGEQPGE